MPVSVEQFVRQLTDSGLASAEDIAVWGSDSKAADAEHFARELVRQKKLTAYQAQQVYSDRGKSLVLGNYVVLDKVGQGGMGMVLKARHRRMQRLVALKVLSPAITKTKDLAARFHREVQAAARLEHPNMFAAYDADEANGTHFLVLQYVEGGNLSSIVKSKGLSGSITPWIACCRRLADWSMPTSGESFIAISSRRTCCSMHTVRSRSSTWAWPALKAKVPATPN